MASRRPPRGRCSGRFAAGMSPIIGHGTGSRRARRIHVVDALHDYPPSAGWDMKVYCRSRRVEEMARSCHRPA